MLKEVYEELNSLTLPADRISHSYVAFFRLQLLELEALVAGLDYEVEQKTYPQKFIQMATQCQLDLIDHSRVFATHQDSIFDGGTHVMAFQKRRTQ